MIEINNLSKAYHSGVFILNNINHRFESRKVTGIVANNGEGKTTLFNCIYGSDKKYEGEITFTGEINHLKKKRDNCGYLPTELFFYPKITGREYVAFCAAAKGKNIQKLGEWGKLFDLPLDEYISNYSTGMKKKIGLLGVLMQDNEILILDEPFNGLDIASNMMVSTIIEKLKSRGKTILLSSHILSTLTDICDYIILLKDGKFENKFSKNDFLELKKIIEGEHLKKPLNMLDNIL